MRYPPPLRRALAALPFRIEIGGRRAHALLAACDRLFETGDEPHVRVAGVTLVLDPASPSERLLFYAPSNLLRTYRRSELYRVLRGLPGRDGRLFVDVGANLGLFSLLARSLGMRALLFEPEPAHLRFLRRNEASIGRVAGWALSDEQGSRPLNVAGATNPGGSSLVSSRTGDAELYVSTSTVEVTTFDAALERLAIDVEEIALVKVDVEGNEERTVRGMQAFLARSNAPVWCEVRGPSAQRSPGSYRAVIEAMAERGYLPYRSVRERAIPFVAERGLPPIFDLLFLKSSRADAG